MDSTSLSLLEMLTPFGALLAFLVWQLVSVSKAKRRRLERERARTKD